MQRRESTEVRGGRAGYGGEGREEGGYAGKGGEVADGMDLRVGERGEGEGYGGLHACSQFILSASPSKGEAEAWTPLSVVSGAAFSPNFSQSAASIPRREEEGALAGSVGPRT